MPDGSTSTHAAASNVPTNGLLDAERRRFVKFSLVTFLAVAAGYAVVAVLGSVLSGAGTAGSLGVAGASALGGLLGPAIAVVTGTVTGHGSTAGPRDAAADGGIGAGAGFLAFYVLSAVVAGAFQAGVGAGELLDYRVLLPLILGVGVTGGIAAYAAAARSEW